MATPKKKTTSSKPTSANIDWKKVTIVASVLLLAAVIAIICICNPAWFEKKKEQLGESYIDGIIITEDDTDSALTIKLTKIAAPISSEPVSPESHLSYKITAKLTPATTTDKFDFKAIWENPSSEWAKGKQLSDYFKLQHEDGAYEAIATTLVPYGEPIILTCKIRNREITKSIKLDYLSKPVNKPDFKVKDITDEADFDVSKFTFSTGSVKPTRLEGTVTVTLWDTIYNDLKSKGWTDLKQSYTFEYNGSTTSLDSVGFGFSNFNNFFDSKLDSTRLSKFTYDFYYTLYVLNGNTDIVSDRFGMRMADVTFSGTAYYMLNGIEINCGAFSANSSPSTFLIESFSGIAIPATDVDVGGDILFYA